MSKPKGADDCIKRMIAKWEMFYVCLTIINRRVQLLRQLYHPRRQVNTHRACTAFCGLGGKSTWSARDIEQGCARMQMYGLEKEIGS